VTAALRPPCRRRRHPAPRQWPCCGHRRKKD